MRDHLSELVTSAKLRVERGYYDNYTDRQASPGSLVKSVERCKTTPIIAEVKFRSPSAGRIRKPHDALAIARSMIDGGACAVSILTDPDNFGGKLEFLAATSRELGVPVVMKDIIVSPKQVVAASRMGASAVLLISEVFSRGLSTTILEDMVAECRKLGLESLVEANDAEQFSRLRDIVPDLYGINNRNLSTFQVDLSTTGKILAKNPSLDRPVVSESGIESADDVRKLRKAGASAFLVGSSIMKSDDVESKVRELVNA